MLSDDDVVPVDVSLVSLLLSSSFDDDDDVDDSDDWEDDDEDDDELPIVNISPSAPDISCEDASCDGTAEVDARLSPGFGIFWSSSIASESSTIASLCFFARAAPIT